MAQRCSGAQVLSPRVSATTAAFSVGYPKMPVLIEGKSDALNIIFYSELETLLITTRKQFRFTRIATLPHRSHRVNHMFRVKIAARRNNRFAGRTTPFTRTNFPRRACSIASPPARRIAPIHTATANKCAVRSRSRWLRPVLWLYRLV